MTTTLKINDLDKNEALTRDAMDKITGGATYFTGRSMVGIWRRGRYVYRRYRYNYKRVSVSYFSRYRTFWSYR